jgi:hypothetical protein
MKKIFESFSDFAKNKMNESRIPNKNSKESERVYNDIVKLFNKSKIEGQLYIENNGEISIFTFSFIDSNKGVIDKFIKTVKDSITTNNVDFEIDDVNYKEGGVVFKVYAEMPDENTFINESHITQGSKVKLPDGRLGTIEAWEDRNQLYTVSIEGQAKTEQFKGDELEVLNSLDGIVREGIDFKKLEKIIDSEIKKLGITKQELEKVYNHDNYETATSYMDTTQILIDALPKKKADGLIVLINVNDIDPDFLLEYISTYVK